MSERYYLLRNNRESGPYLLDELLQQCLLPGDLLWVEGKSQNWAAPSELPEVQTALPKGYSFSPAEPVSFEHISDREHALRAEALRRRALAALYQQQTPVHVGTARPEIPTASHHPLVDPEDLEVVHHKPERLRGALPEFMLFCTLSALVVLGWRGGVFAHLIQVRPVHTAAAVQRLDNESQHAARALSVLPQPSVPGSPLPAATAAAPTPADSARHSDSSVSVAAAPLRHSVATRPLPAPVTDNLPETTGVASRPVVETPAPATSKTEPRREPGTSASGSNTNSVVANPPSPKEKDKEEKPPVTTVATPNVDTPGEEPPKVEKHRGFLRGLFKKKKKEDAPAGNGGE